MIVNLQIQAVYQEYRAETCAYIIVLWSGVQFTAQNWLATRFILTDVTDPYLPPWLFVFHD